MSHILFTLILFIGGQSTLGHADDKKEPSIHVLPLNEHFDANKLAGPGIKIEKVSSELPSRKARDAVFDRSGIIVQVKKWDELEKDLLFMRGKEMDLVRLIARYPSLPKEKLAKLSTLIKRRER